MTTPLDLDAWIALAVAGVTLVGVAFGRLPGVPLDRSGFALVGAATLLALGVVDLETAAHLVDVEVIVLLVGLLLLNEALAEAGFFRSLTLWATRRARGPFTLLVSLVLASGILSALFLNDTIVLMLTPVVIHLTRALGVAPLPYLLALALSANVGSVATVTGNPQNMLVSVAGGIEYGTFAAALAPVALVGLVLVVAVVAVGHRRDVTATAFAHTAPEPQHGASRRLWTLSATALAMLASFVLGANVAVAAFTAGAVSLLLIGPSGPALLRRLDWSLLVLFGGLFVVVGAVRETGAAALAFDALGSWLTAGVVPLALVAAVASNLLSNVPAVLLLLPPIAAGGGGTGDLLVLAMASTLAGNLTLVGSIANLIVAESARRHGVVVGFWAFARVGVPATVLSLAFGVWWSSR
ncbi:MAG: anion transporter [Trueperaceae bacterium]|nr:MAG: anion transporter [Trueperaceae bacterium]